uniref:Uncharacterized protein n=1 Tax=Cercocebus atys TaxID=9531 RepID=A0A2K5KVD6_CERAT
MQTPTSAPFPVLFPLPGRSPCCSPALRWRQSISHLLLVSPDPFAPCWTWQCPLLGSPSPCFGRERPHRGANLLWPQPQEQQALGSAPEARTIARIKALRCLASCPNGHSSP